MQAGESYSIYHNYGDYVKRRSFFGFTFLNIPYFFKYSCTNIFHRRSPYTFYVYVAIFLIGIRSKTKTLYFKYKKYASYLTGTRGPVSDFLKLIMLDNRINICN